MAIRRPDTRAGRDDLFDDEGVRADDATAGAPPAKSFDELLRETPAAPLDAMTKAMLWGLGVLTVLLFLGSLLKIAG